jgi:hypothetical protein
LSQFDRNVSIPLAPAFASSALAVICHTDTSPNSIDHTTSCNHRNKRISLLHIVQLCWLDAFDWKFATGTNQCCAVNSIFEEPSVSVFLIFQNRRIANPIIWVKKSESSNH